VLLGLGIGILAAVPVLLVRAGGARAPAAEVPQVAIVAGDDGAVAGGAGK
jgi:hypothetical protein